MTPAEIIEVVSAFQAGKKVEFRLRLQGRLNPTEDKDEDWLVTTTPNWNFSLHEYRVAREPRRVWLTEDPAYQKLRECYKDTRGAVEFVEVMK